MKVRERRKKIMTVLMLLGDMKKNQDQKMVHDRESWRSKAILKWIKAIQNDSKRFKAIHSCSNDSFRNRKKEIICNKDHENYDRNHKFFKNSEYRQQRSATTKKFYGPAILAVKNWLKTAEKHFKIICEWTSCMQT